MSIIEQWGYDPADKVVILHLDDMGIAHSCNHAIKEIFEHKITSTGSIIAPANWVPDLIHILKNISSQQNSIKNLPLLDIGVHLTLTSEHKNLRWTPMSDPTPISTLVDSTGYMWSTINEAVENVSIEAAEQEMEAQILHLQKNGVELTHLDAHMFTVAHPKFLPSLIKISAKYKIPAFVPEITEFMFKYMGFHDASAPYHRQLDLLRKQNYPLVDEIKFASLDKVK
ncbi:MAG: ChbG/HpnK family deacetylase, partial [Promethearchaeota archaeon]